MLSVDVKSPEGKTPHLNAAEISFIPYVQWLTMFKIIKHPISNMAMENPEFVDDFPIKMFDDISNCHV
jgi:hypothetical protein